MVFQQLLQKSLAYWIVVASGSQGLHGHIQVRRDVARGRSALDQGAGKSLSPMELREKPPLIFRCLVWVSESNGFGSWLDHFSKKTSDRPGNMTFLNSETRKTDIADLAQWLTSTFCDGEIQATRRGLTNTETLNFRNHVKQKSWWWKKDPKRLVHQGHTVLKIQYKHVCVNIWYICILYIIYIYIYTYICILYIIFVYI